MTGNGYNVFMGIIDMIAAAFPDGRPRDVRSLSPLALAYLGDTVYDLFVRAWLVRCTEHTPHDLHLLAAKRVCAFGQAQALAKIEPLLTQDELAVCRRGRNAHSGSVPKNASVADYHAATALESLLGCLFIEGQDARITELMTRILKEDFHG